MTYHLKIMIGHNQVHGGTYVTISPRQVALYPYSLVLDRALHIADPIVRAYLKIHFAAWGDSRSQQIVRNIAISELILVWS